MSNPVSTLFDLSGKVALLTGASGYLGRAFAEVLADAGATVIASSRELARAQAVVDKLSERSGKQHHAIELDQMNESSIQQGFQQAVELGQGIDVLINNGQGGSGRDWTNVTADQFTEQMTNATGYFQLARLTRNHAVENSKSASIVMIGSMYGMVGSYPDAYAGVCNASPAAYHALKGGIIHLTRHLAVYWANDQVRVNCLSPGPFPNPVSVPEGLVPNLEQKSPMRRMGLPDELKGPLLLLASEAGSYMTGQNIVVDGGWTAW